MTGGTIPADFHRGGDAVALNSKDRETERLAAEVASTATRAHGLARPVA